MTEYFLGSTSIMDVVSMLSIIMPAKNEANALLRLLPKLTKLYPNDEIIVINDGSTDSTADVCHTHGVNVVTHPVSMGNGAAIKSGLRHATGDIIVTMDADGQHRPEDIAPMLKRLESSGFDMVVGARGRASQASKARLLGNSCYNFLASHMTGKPILDLTSGFRVVRADKAKQFIHMLPNGFSYPTTLTMAFFRSGYCVDYYPIESDAREGESHINLFRDGVRFFLIIFKVGTLYSPLKIFLPISFLFFMIASCYYGYTFIVMERFTNMSALLYITSTLVFLIGMVSEQITSLIYMISDNAERRESITESSHAE